MNFYGSHDNFLFKFSEPAIEPRMSERYLLTPKEDGTIPPDKRHTHTFDDMFEAEDQSVSLALRVGEPSESVYRKKRTNPDTSMTLAPRANPSKDDPMQRIENVQVYYTSGKNHCY